MEGRKQGWRERSKDKKKEGRKKRRREGWK
jgi:hypothetical protein